MIETYSKNVSVLSGSRIPFNNINLEKGTSTIKQGTGSIQLNNCGVYKVCVTAVATADEAGVVSIQLEKDNVLQPQAVSSYTAADTTSLFTLSFTTLVQVPRNNCRSNCCIAPTVIDVNNAGVGATFETVDIVVDKIC
jgi:hypothetical protein